MRDYDCWCGKPCVYVSAGYCRWGVIRIYRCEDHGNFEVVDAPMQWRGDQIR